MKLLITISEKQHYDGSPVTSFWHFKLFLKDTWYVWVRLCLKNTQLCHIRTL